MLAHLVILGLVAAVQGKLSYVRTWALITGDFSTSQRSPEQRGSRFVMPSMGTAKYGRYQCLTVGKKRCYLPSWGTCFLEYITEGAHCDILYNGSKDVQLSTKSGNCAARCFIMEYSNLPNGPVRRPVGGTKNGVSWFQAVTGDFSISRRSKAHSNDHVKASVVKGVKGQYQCLSNKPRKCMLPSYSTCFLKYVTEKAHCDVMYNGSKDVFVSAKSGNCGVVCYKIYYGNANQMLSNMLQLQSGTFSTAQRSRAHSQDHVKAELRGTDGYQCLTVGRKRCMLPSYATCFLTYLTEKAHCDIMYNGSKDVYVSAKTGNCGVRCFQMASTRSRAELPGADGEPVNVSRVVGLVALGGVAVSLMGAVVFVNRQKAASADSIDETSLLI